MQQTATLQPRNDLDHRLLRDEETPRQLRRGDPFTGADDAEHGVLDSGETDCPQLLLELRAHGLIRLVEEEDRSRPQSLAAFSGRSLA